MNGSASARTSLHWSLRRWQDSYGLALGVVACQKGISVSFTTAAALVHELMEARDEKRLCTLQKHLTNVQLLIIDELGYAPFTAVGSKLLLEVFSRRYEHGALWSHPISRLMNGQVFWNQKAVGTLIADATLTIAIPTGPVPLFWFTFPSAARAALGWLLVCLLV